jgi:hypothetical protein
MSTTNDAKRVAHRSRPSAYVPTVTFGAAVLTAFVVFIPAATTLPKDLALAATSSLFFFLAALTALIARGLSNNDERTVSYWDVAGALTLFGIYAGTLIDSDQLVRLIESQRNAE